MDAGASKASNAERKGRRHGEPREASSRIHRLRTALAYGNGEVHFSEDIYGHDAELAAALAKGYPYP